MNVWFNYQYVTVYLAPGHWLFQHNIMMQLEILWSRMMLPYCISIIIASIIWPISHTTRNALFCTIYTIETNETNETRINIHTESFEINAIEAKQARQDQSRVGTSPHTK